MFVSFVLVAPLGLIGNRSDLRQDKAGRKKDSSFLKKRSKKLLSMAGSIRAPASSDLPDEICKSFLLLFFKKEESSFPWTTRRELPT
jgi:hypothetical protein